MRVVITKKPHRGLAVGSEVTVSNRDGRALIALGLAAVPDVVQAEDPELEVVVTEPVKAEKRRYRRRDMTAEG